MLMFNQFDIDFSKRNRPVKLKALIRNRAVSLIGLLDTRAANLLDLEHSIHEIAGYAEASKTQKVRLIVVSTHKKVWCLAI